MCGFVGFTGDIQNKQRVMEAMLQRIVHRGPDMGDMFFADDVAMGFRRLSILDLTEHGSQPMANDAKDVIITFNGEIYNFAELRAELEPKGYAFHSGADTESLLHAYEEWGEDVVDHLRGMYAFVIWDKRENKLFGARDIFGIKPLYYTRTSKGDMLWGSEIKSFLDHPDFQKEVNKQALRPYLTLQYSATTETFFKGVYKLEAAHCFTYDLATQKMDIRRYWDCDFSPVEKSFEAYVDEVDEVVHESVAAHRIADVKVGSFLSGGVDSSYITACLMPDNTFSVGFEDNGFNETNYASELSERLGVKNFKKMISAEECFNALSEIQYHMDEPQSNLSSVPLYFLAQMASEQVTVVLSGEGADEIFGGYAWYEDNQSVAKAKKLPFSLRRGIGNFARKLPYFRGKNFLMKLAEIPEEYFVGQALVWPENEVDKVLAPAYKKAQGAFDIAGPIYKRVFDKDELTKKQYLDMNMWLPGDILLKADKMCMAHSLELRVPFLDKKVMEFAQHIPARYRVNEHGNKQVLRHAANNVLPDEWATRPKVGFPVPMINWLREDTWYNFVKRYFEAAWAIEFFNTDELMHLLNEHYQGKANNQRKIYTPLVFLIWYERFFILEDN